jgi:hypothetical protein
MRDASVAEVRGRQAVPLGEQVRGLISNGTQQLVSLSSTSVGFVVGAAAPALTALELISRQVEANQEGDELRHAYARDAMHLAVLHLASSALPSGFVERAAHELRASRRGAERILTSVTVSSEYETYRAALEQHAREGIAAARVRGIVDSVSLSMARQDASFDTRFRNDPAFRFGVRAERVRTRVAETQ